MKTLYIVDLEYIESRYTAQWKTCVPEYLTDSLSGYFDVKVIEGNDVPQMTTPGAFLNFGGTTVYKAAQIEKIARMFCAGEIKDGDEFLFTDFWHPGIIFLKYMSSLLNVKIKTHGMIHAGSYDPQDFLGRLDDRAWAGLTEMAMFECFDHVYFATEFHRQLFRKTFPIGENEYGKIRIIGWPFDFMKETIERDTVGIKKKNQVVFPHRIAPEKQLWTFELLKKALPEYEFVVCQDRNLTKKEYHQILAESKIVWSASLQETYGISTCVEGPLAGCVPLAPNSLSYAEIFEKRPFLYNPGMIRSESAFKENIGFFKTLIRDIMKNFDEWSLSVNDYNETKLKEISTFAKFADYLKK